MNKKVILAVGTAGVLTALILAHRGGATPGVELEVLALSVSPSQIEVGQEVVATATVTNAGVAGRGSVIFRVNGQSTTRYVTLDSGETADVTLVIKPQAAGEYAVECGNLDALFVASVSGEVGVRDYFLADYEGPGNYIQSDDRPFPEVSSFSPYENCSLWVGIKNNSGVPVRGPKEFVLRADCENNYSVLRYTDIPIGATVWGQFVWSFTEPGVYPMQVYNRPYATSQSYLFTAYIIVR